MDPDVAKRFVSIVADVAAEHLVHIDGVEIMPDHIHLLVDMDPRYGPARFLKILRGRSSRLLRSEFRFLKSLPSLWTNSCFIATTGGSTIDIVKKYIENQKK